MTKMSKKEIEYWNDRRDEIIGGDLIPDEDYTPPTEDEQAATDAEIDRIMKEYYS